MNEVAFEWRDIAEPSWLDLAETYALKVLDELSLKDWSLSVLICGDEFIQNLNRDYRNKDEPTDVLSFPMGETIEENGIRRYIAGDIVISLPALSRNTADFNVSSDEELKRLILHGILHLAGRDHENNDISQPMLLEQEAVLETLKGERIL